MSNAEKFDDTYAPAENPQQMRRHLNHLLKQISLLEALKSLYAGTGTIEQLSLIAAELDVDHLL